jgi:hypothetical protein
MPEPNQLGNWRKLESSHRRNARRTTGDANRESSGSQATIRTNDNVHATIPTDDGILPL